MKNSKWFHLFLVFLLATYSCTQEKTTSEFKEGVKIALSTDSSALLLSNLPISVIEELEQDSLDNNLWTSFFAVYRDTSDLEMRDFQPVIEGSYTIADGKILFKPTKTWERNTNYFARCYAKTLLRSPEDILARRKIKPIDDFIEFKFSVGE